MPIEVEGPDGAILEFPDGTSRETMRAAMAKRYGSKPAAKPAAKGKPKEQPGRVASFVKGALSGATDVIALPAEMLVRGMSALGVPGAREGEARGKADIARTQAQLQKYRQAHPNYFTAGELTGQTIATAPVTAGAGALLERGGNVMARVAPRAGKVVKAIGTATKTGGLSSGLTKQQIAALPRSARIANLATRAAGGAVSGGLSAGLTGQDVVAGAEFGAGLPIVGNIVGKLGGKAVDLTRMTKLKAGKLIREALGKDADAARAAFSALSPDDQRLARQVLVDAGVEPDTFMALGADVERLRPTEVRNVLESQAAARNARLAQAAGGGTATETRAAGELARRGVSEVTQPQAQAALERANVAGQVVPEAERIAALARQQADEQSGLARRMTFGAERAETRLGQADDLGDVFNPQAVARERGLAGAMTQRGERAAQAAIAQRGVARDMEDVVANMAAEGMQPLQVAPIVGQLRQMAAAPGTRADTLQRGTLVKLAKQLEGLADENGVIDARDLYQIRKTGLNDIVERLLGSRAQPSSGTKERTASLLTSIRPMIDDAIEGAGGQGWKDYLARTRQGFEAVNRQELTAKGAQLAKESPTEFVALMGGERPDIVEGILGKGTKQYDIAGMALADPQRYLALKTAADEIARNNRMAELAQSGRVAANELMGRETPNKLRSLTRMGLSTVPAGRIALEGGEQFVSQLMKPKIGRELAGGFMSGQNALNLMNQYPTATTLAGQISRLPAPALNAIAQIVRGFMTPAETNYSE